ncbi:MAG: peroxiredoxin-like family protein [Verrucomicrobiota bacterium]
MKTLLRHLSFISLLLGLATIATPAVAKDAAPTTFAKVGDTLPDASVLDEAGRSVALRDLVKDGPAVLVFYRGGWCPYCNRHLMALAEAESRILAAGHRIVAISPDQPAKLKATPDREQLGYRLYSDRKADAAQALGIAFRVSDELVAKYKNEYQIDLEAASGETHHLLPHPAVFVVGTDGVIRFAHVNPDYRARLSPEEILAAVEAK